MSYDETLGMGYNARSWTFAYPGSTVFSSLRHTARPRRADDYLDERLNRTKAMNPETGYLTTLHASFQIDKGLANSARGNSEQPRRALSQLAELRGLRDYWRGELYRVLFGVGDRSLIGGGRSGGAISVY